MNAPLILLLEASCAECRRGKVKCDRQVPCNSCKRKNCADLCPNGVKRRKTGIRIFRTSTQRLQRRVEALSSRICQLEEALASLHSMGSSEPHPLLRDIANEEEGSDINYLDDIDTHTERDKLTEVAEAMGTLSVSDNGCSQFIGTTGGCESLLYHSNRIGVSRPTSNPTTIYIFDNRARLFSPSFPLSVPRDKTSDVRGFIESFLPPYEQSKALCMMYFDNASWLFGTVTSSQLMDEMLPVIYFCRGHIPALTTCNTLSAEVAYSGPHDVALLFMVMALGSMLFPDAELADHFHQLANAALLLRPVLEWPSLVTVQTLILMAHYSGMAEGVTGNYNRSTKKRYSLMSIVVHIAQSIGLHRNSANWGLSPTIVDRRKSLFRTVVINDMWESLSSGQTPRVSLTYIDTCLPPSKNGYDFEYLLWRLSTDISSEVISRMNEAEKISYATVIELDEKVRGMALLNDYCACENKLGYLAKSSREALMIYVHHIFFARALLEHPENPLKSPYSSSFVASFRASSALLKFYGEFFRKHPLLGAIAWFMWRSASSAAIIVGLVAAKLPIRSWAQSGLSSLEEAYKMFEKAANSNVQYATAALPVLIKLRERARSALSAPVPDYSSCKKSSACRDTKEPDILDELLLLFSSHSRLLNSDEMQFQDEKLR